MKEDRAKKLAEGALTELKEQLERGHSETLLRFLECVSRFHCYSWTNTLLITIQRPDATHVAGFRKWLEFNRRVRKGEKGIAILAPLRFRRQVEGEDGEKTVVNRIRGFRVVHVFDVTQTVGDELPQLAKVSGEPGELLGSLESLVRVSGIELTYQALPLGTHGLSSQGAISIADRLGAPERFSVLVHELAHEWLHDAERRKTTTNTIRETEAEAVAYAVCRAFGLDCSTSSSDYIQLYQGNAAILAQSLEAIQQTAARIIQGLQADAAPRVAA